MIVLPFRFGGFFERNLHLLDLVVMIDKHKLCVVLTIELNIAFVLPKSS